MSGEEGWIKMLKNIVRSNLQHMDYFPHITLRKESNEIASKTPFKLQKEELNYLVTFLFGHDTSFFKAAATTYYCQKRAQRAIA